MFLPAFLLMFSATAPVSIPPSEWKSIPVRINESNTTVDCRFVVRPDGPPIRASLLSQADEARFQRGRTVTLLQTSSFDRSGHLRVSIQAPGDYVLFLDNRLEGHRTAIVDTVIELSTANRAIVRVLSDERKHIVVAVSLVGFGVILFCASWLVLREVRS